MRLNFNNKNINQEIKTSTHELLTKLPLLVECWAPGARFSKVPRFFGRTPGDNFLCIFKTRASRGTKLGGYFNFCSLYNMSKDQLHRLSGLESYESLFGTAKLLELSRYGPVARIALHMHGQIPPKRRFVLQYCKG